MNILRPTLLALLCVSCSKGSSLPSEISFHGEDQPFPGFNGDTGLVPASSPVQVELAISADGKLTADALAISAGPADMPLVAAQAGSGKFAIHGGFHFGGTLKVAVSGLPSYDGPIPGIDAINVAFDGSSSFDPFLIGKSATTTADIPQTNLPAIPLPGGLPGTLNISIAAGSTVASQFSGVCADVSAGPGAHAQYTGQTVTSGTLKVKPSVVLMVPVLGSKTYDIPEFDVPIPSITRGIDLGTVAVSGGGSSLSGELMARGSCSGTDMDGGVPDDGGTDGGMNPDGGGGGDAGADGGAGGTCGPPQNINPSAIGWVPPYGPHLGVCTPQQVSGFYDGCLGPNASKAACAPFQKGGADQTCGDCLLTDDTQPTYGVLVSSFADVYVNTPGCIALTNSADLSCAQAIQQEVRCDDASCKPACMPNPSDTASSACLSQADSTICSTYATAAQCTLSPSSNNVCLAPMDQPLFTIIANLMCGQPCTDSTQCPPLTNCMSGFCK